MDNNTAYKTQAIDINLLSVLDIAKDGKVVSAEKWVELWNLVFQHINKIDAFCVDMQSTLDNWHESEIALNEIVEDMQMKYAALSTGFIHYGENTPENPHIMLWVRRMNDISTHCFLTNEDVDSELSDTSTNPVQNKVANAALNNKMDKNNPTGTGSFSLNRRANTTVGSDSHAEGSNGRATGTASHAEGIYTNALGSASHAEGYYTSASGDYSHAEGYSTEAQGKISHAEGNNTKASSDYQHVQGKYNIPDSNNIYVDIVGNGSSDTERSNAYTLDWNGNAWYAGDVYVGSTSGTNKDEGSKKLATEEYVNTQITEKTDQTYTPTSANAQSGIAVAEAVSSKADKLTELTELILGDDTPTGYFILKKGAIENYVEKYYSDGSTQNAKYPLAWDTDTLIEIYRTRVSEDGSYEIYVKYLGGCTKYVKKSTSDSGLTHTGTRTSISYASKVSVEEAITEAKGYTDTKIGSIDTALDSIIALQNSYIGGNA